jgi:S-adenosylmethionine:tRNA ribosyltransferase-isomerase
MIAASSRPAARPRFVIPEGREASLPAERRGLQRDQVRLLVATPGGVSHHRFRDLPSILSPGDLIVINTSATVPAAVLRQRDDGGRALVHVSAWLDASRWIVELRRDDNGGPDLTAVEGEVVRLPGELTLTLRCPHPDSASWPSRLWVAEANPATDPVPYLAIHGQPIAYRHLAPGLALADHQTVYAREPGSAEMPSAGRPFSMKLLARVRAAGIGVAALTLHAGVSSPELHELPAPERYAVPASTARLVAETHGAGRRVVAVGTTVVRALETVSPGGGVHGGEGWTDLVLGPGRPARSVTGLITGLHPAEASHLLLLDAVAGSGLVDEAYAAAVERGYLWHEFGDSMLFLP